MLSVCITGYHTGVPTHLIELTCTEGMLKIFCEACVQIGRDERWQLIPESVASPSSHGWMTSVLVEEWWAFLMASLLKIPRVCVERWLCHNSRVPL